MPARYLKRYCLQRPYDVVYVDDVASIKAEGGMLFFWANAAGTELILAVGAAHVVALNEVEPE